MEEQNHEVAEVTQSKELRETSCTLVAYGRWSRRLSLEF
jgi:hypothetical protein